MSATPAAPRVVGLLKVRNEWPLAALALVHALGQHADEVYVLDHGSSDGTAQGLALLKASPLGERIHLVRHDDEAFIEEAFMNALVEVCQASRPDWIYPFDADEFLLAPAGLRPLLASLPDAIQSLHYPLENWISTPSFDESDPLAYRQLRVRSLPDFPLTPSLDPRLMEAIIAGDLNYFRLPFGNKVIFRNSSLAWLAAGAHELRPSFRSQSLFAHRSRLRAAHLPLISHGRLRRKCSAGRRTVLDGMPPWTNWQLQMFARIEELGRLDDFWSRHCIDPTEEVAALRPDGLRISREEELVDVLAIAIEGLRSLAISLNRPTPADGSGSGISQPLPVDLYRLALRASAAHNARRSRHGPAPDAGATPP